MDAVSFPNRGHVQCHVLSYPYPLLPGGLRDMTIRASHHALRDLFKNCRPGEPSRAHVGDVMPFLSGDMVKLENDGISLAAVHTRVLPQVVPHFQVVLVPRSIADHLNMGDVAIAIPQIPEMLVFDEAVLAPRVTDAKLGITKSKFVDGLLDPATATHLGFHA